MAFTEDLTPFLDTDDFAVAATLPGSPATTANVIFDNVYDELNDIEGSQPQALARASDFSAVAIDADITINSTTYRIKQKKPDGTGLVVLILEDRS